MRPALSLALLAALLAGCAPAPVQPWEKGLLARPDMSFGSAPLSVRNADHVYASREAASGGAGAGGGGCGCN